MSIRGTWHPNRCLTPKRTWSQALNMSNWRHRAWEWSDHTHLLEIRLHELAPVVDRFLIVEAATTFTGIPKPLHYWENRGRYAAFADKIMHFNMGALQGPGNWEREWHQR